MPALLKAEELETLQRKVLGATRERMLREMAEAVEALTQERPLILRLEDLHWSDPSTLDLIAYLARRPGPARLLVLGTYRPVDVIVQEHPLKVVNQELQLHGHCVELQLEFLNETAVGEYLARRFAIGAQEVAALVRVARVIHQRTEGNALFIVTVVNELVARGVLAERDGQWELGGELGAIEIPSGLQQFIAQQIERVSPEGQHVLEAASVVGMDFSAAAIAAALEEEIGSVEQRCEDLARREQFVQANGVSEWPDGTVAACYRFTHALYQELLYARVSVSRQIGFHRRIGQRTESGYGERAREVAVELAVHFEQGREYKRAIQYLQRAGENAVQRSAHQEAVRHLTQGLELLQTLADTPERTQQELSLQIALGAPLIATKGYAALEVEKVYARARELCQQVEETPHLFTALRGLGAFYQVRAKYRTVRELGELLLRRAQSVQNPALLLHANHTLGETLLFSGEFAQAREHLERGIALYDPQQHRSHVFMSGQDPGVACLSYTAWTLWFLGYPDQGLKRSQEALSLAQSLAHPFSRVYALLFAGWLRVFRREAQAAQEQAEAVITFSNEQGFPFWVAGGTILQGWGLVAQGHSEEGIAQMRQGLAAWRSMGAEVALAYYLTLIAEAYGKIEQTEEGLAVLTEAAAVVSRSEERFYEAELYRMKGELLLQSGLQKEAEECFQRAIKIARQQSAKSWELRAVISLARLWQQQGKTNEACQLLAEIYGWFTEGFDTADLQEAKALLEELL